ncbi:MAG: pyruvate kinase, partial [Deltaproteobacteria bacterium]|nr:pyruvate kinase [Deltaproteobacteria bacterium]
AWHRAMIRRVRTIARTLGRPVAILQDLGGPKIRIARSFPEPLELSAGTEVVLAERSSRAAGAWLAFSEPAVVKALKPGHRVLLADGTVELRVTRRGTAGLSARVERGGPVRPRAGVNLPDTHLALPSLTPRDLADVELGVREGVDWIALSFVRHARDVKALKAVLRRLRADIPVMAKIEKPQALDGLEGILDAADGAMVARGDLGVELALENVPLAQKRIIRECRRRAIPVITATQMLESMVRNEVPTRAEVSDVANAILDGTDAVMLSAETSIGDNPVLACSTANRICRVVEPEELAPLRAWPEPLGGIEGAVARAAVSMARELGASALLACTLSGRTARLVSALRPSAPLVAVTPDERTRRRLALLWGVEPCCCTGPGGTDCMLRDALAAARREGLAIEGRPFVVIAGSSPDDPGRTNLIRVEGGPA